MKFKVTIENFEGPIDALLQLIEKKKMSISDISLADITDDYINFVRSLDDKSISHTTHFILVASTLTLIKSKSLLPNLELTNEEEDDIENLKRRIEIFKVFKESALSLKEHISISPYFYYPKARKKEVVFTPHRNITTSNLKEALVQIFSEIPQKDPKKKEAYIRIAVHIEDMMLSLEQRITKTLKTDFSSFISHQIGERKEPKAIKVYKVIGFLAMLELVKKGVLGVLQEENFENIMIESVDSH